MTPKGHNSQIGLLRTQPTRACLAMPVANGVRSGFLKALAGIDVRGLDKRDVSAWTIVATDPELPFDARRSGRHPHPCVADPRPAQHVDLDVRDARCGGARRLGTARRHEVTTQAEGHETGMLHPGLLPGRR